MRASSQGTLDMVLTVLLMALVGWWFWVSHGVENNKRFFIVAAVTVGGIAVLAR